MTIEEMTRSGATTSPEVAAVLAMAREKGIQMVDVKFVDLPGTWQHFTVPVGQLGPDAFTAGLGFDGSSIRGFQKIQESDMLLVLDPTTAFIDEVAKAPTLSLTGNVVDPLTGQPYPKDPRYIAQQAERYLVSTGIATTSYWGPEVEFYVFNDIRFDTTSHCGFYFINSDEGIWNSGVNGGAPNLGYRPRYKEGYFPVPPTDKLQDLRSEMVLRLIRAGVDVEAHHHEVGTAGQCEIDMRFNTLTRMADQVMMYKYIIKNTAIERGYTVTFMPKPLFGDNGSGMHVHQSLWKDDQPLMYDGGKYAQLSDTARWYIGGLIAHTPALLAFAAPTTNSYRRLVPGYEAPVKLAYSARNRSACVRIPMYSNSPKARRIEFRCPDPSANPYLCFAALLMAGIDGIQNQIEPPTPLDKDLYELEGDEAKLVKDAPGSLAEVLNALEADHEFLLKGDVFSTELIESYIDYKRERELAPVNLRPHPMEFFLYYDV